MSLSRRVAVQLSPSALHRIDHPSVDPSARAHVRRRRFWRTGAFSFLVVAGECRLPLFAPRCHSLRVNAAYS